MVGLMRFAAVALVVWGYGGVLVAQVLAGGGEPAAGVLSSAIPRLAWTALIGVGLLISAAVIEPYLRGERGYAGAVVVEFGREPVGIRIMTVYADAQSEPGGLKIVTAYNAKHGLARLLTVAALLDHACHVMRCGAYATTMEVFEPQEGKH